MTLCDFIQKTVCSSKWKTPIVKQFISSSLATFSQNRMEAPNVPETSFFWYILLRKFLASMTVTSRAQHGFEILLGNFVGAIQKIRKMIFVQKICSVRGVKVELSYMRRVNFNLWNFGPATVWLYFISQNVFEWCACSCRLVHAHCQETVFVRFLSTEKANIKCCSHLGAWSFAHGRYSKKHS